MIIGKDVEPPKEAAVIFAYGVCVVTSQVLYVAAELGVADHLDHGALSAQDLASKIGAHVGALARLLQALVAFGILKREGEERFGLTPTGEFLRSDVAGSLRSTVRFLVGRWAWRAFEQLDHRVRTGEPAFDHVWGMSNFEYWARNPNVSKNPRRSDDRADSHGDGAGAGRVRLFTRLVSAGVIAKSASQNDLVPAVGPRSRSFYHR
jgi:methyltransferase family protein